jgi:hypothetical protein
VPSDRAKLPAASGYAPKSGQRAAFIDLGAMKEAVGVPSMAHSPASPAPIWLQACAA